MTTFRGRLAMTMSAMSFGILALASLLIYAGIRWALVRNLDEALLALARTEIASAFDGPGGMLHVHDQAPIALNLGGQFTYDKMSQIVDAHGSALARTSNVASGPAFELDARLLAHAIAGNARKTDTRWRDDVHRTLYHPLDDGHGSPLALVVAVSRRPLDLTLDAVAGVLIVALVTAGALAAFVASHVAHRLTLPLDRIAQAANTVGEFHLARRIPRVSDDTELRAVVGFLNDMLDRLERAFTSRRRFVADASHELRSPLSNLRSTIEVALRQPRTADDYREVLRAALAEVERLGRLVQGLLTLTRTEGRTAPLTRARVDLGRVGTTAIEAHSARAAVGQVDLDCLVDGSVVVDGDADRLREVADNLLDNALRLAPQRSRVQMRVYPSGDQGVLEVEDAGPGLSADDQAIIFEPFARGSTRDGEGAGLGLTIARSIAAAHGGTLTVRSAPGQGACFRLSIPLARAS